NPLGALLDGRIGKTDDDRLLQAATGDVHLHLAENPLDPFEGHTVQPRQHLLPSIDSALKALILRHLTHFHKEIHGSQPAPSALGSCRTSLLARPPEVVPNPLALANAPRVRHHARNGER